MIEHSMIFLCLLIFAFEDVKGVVHESRFFHVCVLELWDAVIYVNNDSNETVALTLMMRICCEVLLLIWIIH